jgi:hypothetical protein
MATEDEGIEGSSDPSKLRRFALGVALVLAVMVLAGGTIKEEFQGSIIGVMKFQRPGVLVALLVLLSFYASARYAYYALISPVTRGRVRRYLKNDWSMTCIKMPEPLYRSTIQNQGDRLFNNHIRMERLCLPGLTPWDFIVFTDHNRTPDEEFIKHVLANRANAFFPGITPAEITLGEWASDHVQAKVGPLKLRTTWKVQLEQFDIYLPLIANGFAILLFVFWILAPLVK